MRSFAIVVSVSIVCSFYGANCSIDRTIECANLVNEFKEMRTQVSCKPRESLHKLMPESTGYSYYPEVVLVNKCEGMCGQLLSCKPSNTTKKLVPVMRIPIFGLTSCYLLYIEDHTKCKCECSETEKDCNARQVYDADSCKCKCKNIQEMLQCMTRKDTKWEPSRCSCICRFEQECSTGLVWIPALCRCSRVVS